MLFHSFEFVLLLAAVLLLDRVLFRVLDRERGWRVRCGVYLAASFVFYGAWDWRYLPLMLFSIVLDYLVGRRLEAETRPAVRRAWLAASVVTQIGLLAAFKYWTFLRTSLAPAGVALPAVDLLDALPPLGISFYTFQSLSYTVDVYRRVIPAERSLSSFALFVAFFPQLVAGPIVRASDFLWQLRVPKAPRLPRLLSGLERFAVGLFKKTVIADNLTPFTDPVFADPGRFSAVNNAFALAAWGIVIYCDFSAYSDMAIGTARMLGFRFLENFRFPYLARSVPDFWRRWHISLSQWLRDYLYVPLGGSRQGFAATAAALAVTMLLGGLWHGASWNFVLWGAWWGAWLVLAHAWRRAPERWRRALPTAVTWPATLAIAFLGWVPFRCQDFATTGAMLDRLFSADLLASVGSGEFIRLAELPVGRATSWAAALGLASFAAVHLAAPLLRLDSTARDAGPAWLRRVRSRWIASRSPWLRGFALAAAFAICLLLRTTENETFVYFQF